MADSFATRFAAVRSRYGPLAWGLDPSGAILDASGLGDTPDGLDRFADVALEYRWQRDQLPEAIRELVLDDQRLRNDLCWSVFHC